MKYWFFIVALFPRGWNAFVFGNCCFFLVVAKFQLILKSNVDTEGLIYIATIKLKQIRSFYGIEGFQNAIL